MARRDSITAKGEAASAFLLAALHKQDHRTAALKAANARAEGERDAAARQLAAQAAELAALRRVVRGLLDGETWSQDGAWITGRGAYGSTLPAALRAAGDEPGAAAVEAALRGGT